MKKFFSLSVLSVMLCALCLCACGKGTGEGTTAEVQTVSQTTEASRTQPQTELKTEPEPALLNHEITMNGYTFELGCKLDDFVSGTGAVLTKKDVNAAREKGSTAEKFSSVEAKIVSGGSTARFHVYVRADGDGNMILEGIKCENQRGYSKAAPGFLKRPNVFKCGFSFLDGCDIDKTFYADAPDDWKKEARYTESKNIGGKYTVKLTDESGYYAEIDFNNYKVGLTDFYMGKVVLTSDIERMP